VGFFDGRCRRFDSHWATGHFEPQSALYGLSLPSFCSGLLICFCTRLCAPLSLPYIAQDMRTYQRIFYPILGNLIATPSVLLSLLPLLNSDKKTNAHQKCKSWSSLSSQVSQVFFYWRAERLESKMTPKSDIFYSATTTTITTCFINPIQSYPLVREKARLGIKN
jgi:hypothetical protein